MNLSSSKAALLWLLLVWQSSAQPLAPSARFRYRRVVTIAAVGARSAEAAQACAALDAEVFAHAAPSLKDLRLYTGATEIPYVTTVSEPLQQESDDARILNRRSRSGHILFDLEMPRRRYTSITLDLAAHDYIAEAIVSGGDDASGGKATPLGRFTLFDLTSQKLSHSSEIALSEAMFPYLHVDLKLTPTVGGGSGLLRAPSIVRAASVPPSREAQSIYTTTQVQPVVARQGPESVATFQIPARVPVERIAFTLPSGYKGSFSRVVRIAARGVPETATEDAAAFRQEDVTGIILRVKESVSGHDLAAEDLSIPVSIGSNMQQPARIQVMVENGADGPVPIAAVELQMRQRRICFDSAAAVATAAAPITLYYGDASADAPIYSDGTISRVAANPRIAVLGAEIVNPNVASAMPTRRAARQRPVLRWVALLGCVFLFALLVIRSAKKRMAHL